MIVTVSLITVALAVLPLCVFAGLMHDRPGRPLAGPVWHLCLTVSWMLGLLGTYAGLIVVLGRLSRSQPVGDFLFYGFVVLGAPIGASVGPGLMYLYYRMRTARDPDYEELTRPGNDSIKADVPQPGHGDDILPE